MMDDKRIEELERRVAELEKRLSPPDDLNAFKKLADEFNEKTRKEYVPYPVPYPVYPPYPTSPYTYMTPFICTSQTTVGAYMR